MPIERNTFIAPWWLRGGHRQTMYQTLVRKVDGLDVLRERVTLPDGDFVDIDMVGCDAQNNQPVVLILPGLEGDIHSMYARGILKQIINAGWTGVLMNMRGCSGEINLLPRSYHSGETDDVRVVIDYVLDKFKQRPLGMIGYSLGGNMLVKYLGEQGGDTPVVCAAAVSVPYDLAKCATRINKGFSRVYEKRLVKSMQATLKAKLAAMDLPLPVGVDDVEQLSTLWLFDDKVTGPLHGFKNAEDYYQKCSSMQFVSAMKRPVLLIHALDDPFLDVLAVPDSKDLPSDCLLKLNEHGGHVGFIFGDIRNPRYYLEEQIMNWFNNMLR